MPGPASIHCACQMPGFDSRTKYSGTFTQASASSAAAAKTEAAVNATNATNQKNRAKQKWTDFTATFFRRCRAGGKSDSVCLNPAGSSPALQPAAAFHPFRGEVGPGGDWLLRPSQSVTVAAGGIDVQLERHFRLLKGERV